MPETCRILSIHSLLNCSSPPEIFMVSFCLRFLYLLLLWILQSQCSYPLNHQVLQKFSQCSQLRCHQLLTLRRGRPLALWGLHFHQSQYFEKVPKLPKIIHLQAYLNKGWWNIMNTFIIVPIIVNVYIIFLPPFIKN